ncbi:MAG: DUF2764 domain-containing protein [Alistipes sp.]|nr:DUF2764 domain-containing protein [Alistipes sp.]
MFEKNYYSLVSGLKEYALDSDTKGFDATQIVAEILEELSSRDAAAVRLLYGYYDCENIAAARGGRTAFNTLGTLSQEEVAEALKTGAGVPTAVAQVIRAFADPEGEDAEEVDLTRGFENALFAAYYRECGRSSCRFLREWSEFDRTLRNITAALAARAAQRPVDSVTVGGGDVVEQLQRSSSADFGLRGELPYIDAVIAAVNDETNMLEKERKIDMVRWETADEIAAFDYFNIGAVLSYLVKINIVARWSVLDPKRGREIFERLMAELDGKDLINKQ